MFLLSKPVEAQCSYTVQEISAPCSFGNITTLGLSDLGHVAGDYGCISFDDRPFLWSNGSLSAIPLPQTMPDGRALAVNTDPITVGWMSPTSSGAMFAFQFDGKTLINLGVLPGHDSSEAIAISNSKPPRIVGYSMNSVTGPLTAVFWESGTLTPLTLPIGPNAQAFDVNDNLQIVGWMGTSQANSHGFLWDDGNAKDLGIPSGGTTSTAQAINNSSVICGNYRIPNPKGGPVVARGWVLKNGEYTDIGVLPGYLRSFAVDINDEDIVVGTCNGDGPGETQTSPAFIWQDGVATPLEYLIPTELGYVLLDTRGINNAGQIIVDAENMNGDVVGLLLTPTPPTPGDTNCDQSVDVDDLQTVITAWGEKGGAADLDKNGTVDVDDLMLVIVNWS